MTRVFGLLVGIAAVSLVFAKTSFAGDYGMLENGWGERIREGVFKVADTDFEEGLSIFEQYIEAFPDSPAGYFFYAAGVQEKIQKRNDLGELDRFYKYADKCERLCDRNLKRDPNDTISRLFFGAIHGYKGLIEAKQRHLVKAFLDGVEAKKNLEKVAMERPEIPDTYFGLGMLYYFSSRKSDEGGRVLSWIIHKFITHGRDMKDDGVEMIKRAITGDALSKDYALSGLMWIHLYEKRYEQAREIALELQRRFTRDNISRWILGRVALVENRCQDARHWFEEIIRIYDAQGVPDTRWLDVLAAIKMADLCQSVDDKKWNEAKRLSVEVDEWLNDDPKVFIEYQNEKKLISFWKEENHKVRGRLRFIENR